MLKILAYIKYQSLNDTSTNDIVSFEQLDLNLNKGNSRPRWLSWMRRPTGDQEVAGSTPARSATFFRGDWSWNIFYGHSLPSADSRMAVVSFWRKNVHNTG